MKLALDVWYELWEKAGSEGDPGHEQHPDVEDRHYPWLEDNFLTWNGNMRPRSVYYASLGRTENR